LVKNNFVVKCAPSYVLDAYKPKGELILWHHKYTTILWSYSVPSSFAFINTILTEVTKGKLLTIYYFFQFSKHNKF